MTSPYPTNPPYVMGSSLLTVFGLGSSLETVFAPGNPPLGGFLPSNITGLIGWWDASQIAGISSGASLSVWTDLSGSGHHLNQASAASQPVFVTNAQNGRSVVSAWGAAAASLGSSFMTAGFSQSQPVTLAMAFSIKVNNFQQDVLDGVTGASMILGPIFASTFQAFGGATLDSLLAISATSWYVGGCIFNGSASTVFLSSSISAGNAGATAPAGLAVFARADGSNPAGAKIGELSMYNRVLTGTELSRLTGYLQSKWSTF